MANLIRKYSGNEVAQSGAAWDPVRLMRDMLRWDPFHEIEAVLNPADIRGFAPTFEVTETKDAYLFRADLPGVQEKDLEISLTGTRLSIAGHREQERREQTDTLYASERAYGSFSRAFTLPEGVDGENVMADLKSGVLTLTVPKKPEVQPKKIVIGGADKAPGGEKAKA
ncbi:MAG TPA: HSP20 family small heat-shock protein [Polyangia bacterium]|jgi:HSP20 family protein|nr:HSP20 family small heat-shock protein [Polyangia bacterium]